jgi:hypothetical protein
MRRKERNTKKIIGYTMMIVMVGSLFGIVFYGFQDLSQTSQKYNGIDFVNRGSFWTAKINGIENAFTNHPSQVEQMAVQIEAIDNLAGIVQIDTTSDIEDPLSEPIALAQFQMDPVMNSQNKFTRHGFTSENNFKFPIIRCSDATDLIPVLHFKHGNSTRVFLEGNCIIAQAVTGSDLIAIKDRILYGILGVI